jgi:hypothetical protein
VKWIVSKYLQERGMANISPEMWNLIDVLIHAAWRLNVENMSRLYTTAHQRELDIAIALLGKQVREEMKL